MFRASKNKVKSQHMLKHEFLPLFWFLCYKLLLSIIVGLCTDNFSNKYKLVACNKRKMRKMIRKKFNLRTLSVEKYCRYSKKWIDESSVLKNKVVFD